MATIIIVVRRSYGCHIDQKGFKHLGNNWFESELLSWISNNAYEIKDNPSSKRVPFQNPLINGRFELIEDSYLTEINVNHIHLWKSLISFQPSHLEIFVIRQKGEGPW